MWDTLSTSPAWPDGLRKIATTDAAGYLGGRQLGRFDIVTLWDSDPDPAGLDSWIADTLQHPAIETVEYAGGDGLWFGKHGLRAGCIDGSRVYIRYLPDPDGDRRVLHIRLISAAPPSGDVSVGARTARELLMSALDARTRGNHDLAAECEQEAGGTPEDLPQRIATRRA